MGKATRAMLLDNTERLYLERQVTLARAVIAALSLVALLETSRAPVRGVSVVFLSVYLAIAVAAALAERFLAENPIRIPLLFDFGVLAAFVYLTPSVSAFWFLFLFAVFALATRGNERAMLALVALATVGIILRVAAEESFRLQGSWHWIAIGLGTLVSGLGMGFLGAREREHLAHQQFLEKIVSLLRFERGLTESIRKALGELADGFQCDQASLVIRDEDLERIFVWKVKVTDAQQAPPETLPLSRSETYLLDSFEVSMGWDFNGGKGEGFGWDRRTGQRIRSVPAPPDSTKEDVGAKLIAVTIESGERPTGRVLLSAPRASRGRFSASDLRWLEHIVRQIGPPLENIFLLRSLRTHAVESERSRISRDLHDGILQTLLSLKIQLNVLRQRLPEKPLEQACADIASLQNTVQAESDELRRFVTDLRPVRVESADMRELMQGFAERFRLEHGLAIDLFVEARDLRVPDRICRELFQIYRESLHNVKKHAEASHVVVKLVQDEAKVS
ncbi:MAG TPA: histidine kinase, partial [Candidatus Aquilonibacter sp.]|nr:histidine kinase [Candidatus Aquilonibacter sp.]